MNKNILTIALLSFAATAAFAQDEAEEVAAPVQARKVLPSQSVPTVEVKGRVIDAATKSPAAGIRVTAYNDNRYAAMTDENGEYTIKVPTYTTSLSLSAEGYTNVQQAIGKEAGVVQTQMYSSNFAEIYTKQTSATSSRTANVGYNNNDMSIDGQIQTSLGGDLLAISRGGVVGQGMALLMNGVNSLNANAQPLIVIDGVIQDMQLNRPSLHDGFFNNILANIMVEDIERISVLKNGTAIYGAKGANGVVVIETKRNKSMATKIDLSIGGSYEFVPRHVEMMNGEQFRVYASELISSTGTKSNNFKFLYSDPSYYYYPTYHNNTDWSKEVYRKAFTQSYSINVQGGDDIANYNLSVGYAFGNSTLRNNDFSRFNMRFNTDISLARQLSVRFDASYSDVTRDMRDDGIKSNINDGVISSPSFLADIKSPFLSPYAYDVHGKLSHFIAGPDDYLRDVFSTNQHRTQLANPTAILHYGDGDNKNYFGNRMINLAITPKWDINRYWSLSEHFAFQLVNTDENYYLPTNGVPRYEVEGVGLVQNAAASLAGKQTNIMSDTYFDYNRRFKAHMLNARGGVRYLNSSYKLNTQMGYNSGNDKTPNMSSSLENKVTDGADDEVIDINYYAQANYNYAERYYLTAAMSMNGSSRFGADAKDGIKIADYAWGFFPSIEGAWVMSNERWFNVPGINYFKVNVGYDLLGNDDISATASKTYFVAGKVYNMVSGLTLGNIGNTRLQWETTGRFTVGAQLAALNNRLFLGFNYFHSRTSNLISLNSLSYLTGMNTNWTNGGRMTNNGFDITANAKLVSTKDWSWSLGATVGHYKNELTALPGGKKEFETELFGGTVLSRVGQSAGVFYGYKTKGVYATTEEAQKAYKTNVDGKEIVRPLAIVDKAGNPTYFGAGDVKFVDKDNNGIIDKNDRFVIGNPNPDFYGTFNSSLHYRRLALDVVFTYSVGNDIYNYKRSILEGGNKFYNQTTAMLSRWTVEGQKTDIPRACYGDPMGNSRFSDRWIEDGSYLRLKNITLSYDIPISNTYIQGLTLWGAANNLCTWTKYLGSDPEGAQSNTVLGMGIDRGIVPSGRSVAFGVKINL